MPPTAYDFDTLLYVNTELADADAAVAACAAAVAEFEADVAELDAAVTFVVAVLAEDAAFTSDV